jgi:hypothetical protein
MMYDRAKILAQALKLSEQPDTYTVEDVFTLLPCSKSTFYSMFPDGSDELDTIKAQLETNKVNMKIQLRAKLARGEKATEIIALYKLIATDDERRALSMNHTDITSNGNTIAVAPIKWADE